MSVPRLSVVPTEETVDTPAARAGRLYAEAQQAAYEQVHVLETSLERVVALAAEIAGGGDVYPAGVRDLCRRMSEEVRQRGQTLDAIASRGLDRAH
jgi:transglutaminase-like putative cysteine protease